MVSLEGVDEPRCLTTSLTNPCKTMGYAVMGEHNMICMNGTFQNLSDTIKISDNTPSTQDREITFLCVSCLLNDSRVIIDNRLGKSLHVYFVNFTMKNSSIQLKNVLVTFKDAVLEQIVIQDFKMSPIQICFEDSSLSCSDAKTCGLFLLNSSYVKCVIENSYFERFTLKMDIKALMLTINNTIFTQPALSEEIAQSTVYHHLK